MSHEASVNYRGGQSLHCEIHVVGLVTDRGRRDGKVAGRAAATLPGGWGDKTEYDQAHELGEGVSHHDADLFVQHQPRWPGRIFYLNAGAGGQEGRSVPSLFLHILGRPSPAFLLLTHARSRSMLLTSLIDPFLHSQT